MCWTCLVGTEDGLMVLAEDVGIVMTPVAGVFKLERDSQVLGFHCSCSTQVEQLLGPEFDEADFD